MKKSYWGGHRPRTISEASRKEYAEADGTAASDDFFATLARDEAPAPEPAEEEIVQRPNAVVRDGGTQLLRGLMLPLPPSANRYWRSLMMVVKGTKFPLTATSMQHLYKLVRLMNVPTEDNKLYCKRIGEMALQRGFRFFTSKPLRMEVVVCPRDRRSIDAHNYAKVLLDALEQAGLYEDDAQVEELRVRMGSVIKGGRVVVSLWEIAPDRDAILKEAWR